MTLIWTRGRPLPASPVVSAKKLVHKGGSDFHLCVQLVRLLAHDPGDIDAPVLSSRQQRVCADCHD
ncbi:MAG: hypothetical protein ACI841_005224 [Planctomycetota bacterium]|jgi:hypothetical protein